MKTNKKEDTTVVRNKRGNLWCIKLHSSYTAVCELYEYMQTTFMATHGEQEYLKGLQLYKNTAWGNEQHLQTMV